MNKRPLLTFDLEGTLGDIFLKSEYIQKSQMFLRPGLVAGLKSLRESERNYHMALATKASGDVAAIFVEYLKEQGFEFEAVYDVETTSENPPRDSMIRHFKDLSKVYADFGISSDELEERVLVVEDLQLPVSEIYVGEKTVQGFGDRYVKSRTAEELIYHCGQANTYGNPLPKDGQVPPVLLVPNPRSNKFEAVPMEKIVELVNAIYESGRGNVATGFDRFVRSDVIKFETGMNGMERYQFNYLGEEAESDRFVAEVSSGFNQKYFIMAPPENSPTSRYELVNI